MKESRSRREVNDVPPYGGTFLLFCCLMTGKGEDMFSEEIDVAV